MKRVPMRLLVLLIAMTLGASNMWAELSVQTKIFDASSQPMLVGGQIDNYSSDVISKKGMS